MKGLATKIFIGLAFAISAMVIVYLGFSFIAWDFNPQRWDIGGRLFFVALSLPASAGVFIIPFDLVKS